MTDEHASLESADRAALVQRGLKPVQYEGQDGEFLMAKLPVQALPNIAPLVIDQELVFGEDLAVVEVCPDATVQLYLPSSHTLYGRHPMHSPEGQAILADAYHALAARPGNKHR